MSKDRLVEIANRWDGMALHKQHSKDISFLLNYINKQDDQLEKLENALERLKAMHQNDIDYNIYLSEKNERCRKEIEKVLKRERSDILYTQKEALRDIERILKGDPYESS